MSSAFWAEPAQLGPASGKVLLPMSKEPMEKQIGAAWSGTARDKRTSGKGA